MTLLGGGGLRDSVTKNHKGEGGSQQQCHVTFYQIKIGFILVLLLKCHVVTHRGEGKAKKCHIFFEWPFKKGEERKTI